MTRSEFRVIHPDMAERFLSVLILVFFLLFPVTAGYAQTGGPVSRDIIPVQTETSPANPSSDPSAWIRILDSTSQALSREGVTDTELDRLFDETGKIREAANAEAQKLQGEVDRLQQQLTELGKPPADGEPPEAPEAKERRELLNQDFANTDALLKNARVAEVRARQLQKEIGDLLHSRFIQSISIRTSGLTTTAFWREFFIGFGGFYKSLNLLLSDSLSVFVKELGAETRRMVLLPFFLLLLALVIFRARRFFGSPPQG